MQAKKCDRCGKLYELYNTENNGKKCNGFRPLNINWDQKACPQGLYDMCPECMEALMTWLYAVKNRKEG